MDSESQPSLLSKIKHALTGSKAGTSEQLEKEIQELVGQGEANGLMSEDEAGMIESVLSLDEYTAAQIMVPRTELAMVSHDSQVGELIRTIIESGHSRIPVYTDDPDHIVGVVYAKDLLPFWGDSPEKVDLARVARQPVFIPQSMPVSELMGLLRSKRVHLAVVVDEYGGTAGVVTLEDVLEEIVGEIEDEYDQTHEMLIKEKDGSFLVDARLEIEDLAEHLGVNLPEELPEGRFETVGGFISTLLGRVPRRGEKAEYRGVCMEVAEADARRVLQVRVRHAKAIASPPGE